MVEATTENNRAISVPKPPENEYDTQRDVKVYKHRQFEIAEVDKERIDNIKITVDNAKANINKGAISSDVVLALSTTFFGGFIGCIPDIVKMINSNQITTIIFFYFALILAAIILFLIYLSMQRKKRLDATALIERIAQETDSIFKSWTTSDNALPEGISSNQFSGVQK